MNFFQFISKFSIRKQIMLGYLPIVILLGFLIFNSQAKFETFSQNFLKLETSTKENVTFLEIERDMNELERSVLAYSYIGFGGVLRRISHLQEQIDQKFALTRSIVSRDEEMRVRFDRVFEHYETYKTAFQRSINMQSEMQSYLKEGMQPSYLIIISTLDEMQDYAGDKNLPSVVLFGARLENRWFRIASNLHSFQTTPDNKLIRETAKLIDDSYQTLNNLEKYGPDQNLLSQIKILQDESLKYKESYLKYINTNSTHLHLINVVLAGKAAEIDKLLAELDELSNVKSLSLSRTILKNNKNAHLYFIMSSIFIGFSGLLLAWLVASGIAHPVSEMAKKLLRLADGEFDTVIPAVERRDEVGAMAKAADAFKKMAFECLAADERVKEALQFQNLVNENIPDLVFVKDSEYRILQANPAFLKMYPKDKRDKVIGYTTLEDYPEDQVKEFLKFDRQALEEGYSETEETITFPNGRVCVLFTKKVRFENNEGEKFILGVARDITDAKKAEAEILRSNEELERFAYIASHDLQEPLRMVSNFTGLLNEEYGADMDEQAQKYMKFSLEASQRMQLLISDLLEYSRTGAEETAFSSFNAGQSVQSAVENLRSLVEESGAQIDIGDMPEIFSHPMRFSRLMQNLITNAIKYRHEDKAPEVKVRAERRSNEWLFSVHDNGIGIKEEYQKQIFAIFKRLHHRQEYSGTGIGLAICNKIVESFGGQLWVVSEFGEGSVFYFTVPDKIA